MPRSSPPVSAAQPFGEGRVAGRGQASERQARALTALLAFAALLLFCGARAAAQEGQPIKDVVLERDVGVDHALLRGNLRCKQGVPFAQNLVDEDVRWLADTHGILAEVAVEPGPLVRFTLSRIRRYDGAAVEGNTRYDEDELLGVARLKKDRDATPDQVATGRELVRDKYLAAGYAFVQVDIRTRTGKNAERTALLRVFEGPQVETQDVRIEGLTALAADDALSVMRSPRGFWSWLIGKDFVRSEVDGDVVLLENFVRGEGYLDGRVALKSLDWSDTRDEVTVTLLVDEGPRYTVRSLSVQGNSAIPTETLTAAAPIGVGLPWRRPDLLRTLRAMRDQYGRLGYIDVEIDPQESYDETLPVLDVVLAVTEGQPKTVRDVIVRGNTGTLDDVVRRYITLKPGDTADTSELRYSEDQLVSLEYFTSFEGAPQVRVDTQQAPDPGQVDIITDVNDEQSGLFNFLVGAGSDSGLFVGASVNKYNFDITKVPSSTGRIITEFFGTGDAFHGAGQRLTFRVEPGTQTTDIDISFRDPWLDRRDVDPWGLNVELYKRERRFSDYDRGTLGFAFGLDKKLSRKTTLSFGVRVEDTDISSVDEDQVPTIAKDEGTTRSQALEGGWSYQDLDSLYEPTRGFVTGLRVESAGNGLGGDTDLVRGQLTGEWYAPIHEDDEGHKSVFHPRLALGRVEETSGDLPFFENYFVGGSTGPFALRGFDFQGVGPHESGNALGGKTAAVASLEALIPLISQYNPFRDEDDTILKGVLFFDAGNLVPDGAFGDLAKDFRFGAGGGIRLRLPALGGITLALDYALLTSDQAGDEKRSLSFELSRRF
ncbi:MAG TPA: outer membrane protein assembly factor [Planctomycetota bacterium]|nr:outer membrane protein assembly factor [Planctomycetota bacterium]